MKSRMACPVRTLLAFVFLAPLAGGCNKQLETRVPPLAEARIRNLASICSQFGASQRRVPASMEELKAWAKKLNKAQLANLGIDNVAEAFVSPRDQQPYVLVRGGSTMMLAYEKTGEGGKHYVVTNTGSVYELADAVLKERLSAAR